MLCTGRPLEAGQALDPSRIDAIAVQIAVIKSAGASRTRTARSGMTATARAAPVSCCLMNHFTQR